MTDGAPMKNELRKGFSTQRLGWIDLVLLVAAFVVWWVWPLYLPLAVNVIVMIILVMALDLAMGWGGIDALGHAAFFGVGAYTAANFALHLTQEPFTGLLAGAVLAGALGLLSGFAVLRARGLTQIMLTLTVASLMLELANTLKGLTNGDDGLIGYHMAPVFGIFEFSLRNATAYWYAFGVLVVVYLLSRWIVNSPFGLSVRGIRDNPTRMRVIGVPVQRRLLSLYTLSGAFAGVAGALSAQVTLAVGLDSLSFVVSANAAVMLVLGGAGTLYGAFFGAIPVRGVVRSCRGTGPGELAAGAGHPADPDGALCAGWCGRLVAAAAKVEAMSPCAAAAHLARVSGQSTKATR